MKWLPDPTGRFPQRPYYEGNELDHECEGIVVAFLTKRHGRVDYPISTNDLCVLIEQSTTDFDEWADLSNDGADVQGKTIFSRRGKPSVYVSAALQEPHRENRRRTTLTHELGHARIHNYLVGLEAAPAPACCTQKNILGASAVDWLEWQAGYCSGAFLMPISPLRRAIRDAKRVVGFTGTPTPASPAGQELIHRIHQSFQVSADAARVRLLQLGLLAE